MNFIDIDNLGYSSNMFSCIANATAGIVVYLWSTDTWFENIKVYKTIKWLNSIKSHSSKETKSIIKELRGQ